MLTDEAFLARRWRSLPLLRAALEGKTVPQTEWRTSIEQGPIERLEELVGIAKLVTVHKQALKDRSQAAAVHDEIERLSSELEGLTGWFNVRSRELSHGLRQVHRYLELPDDEPNGQDGGA